MKNTRTIIYVLLALTALVTALFFRYPQDSHSLGTSTGSSTNSSLISTPTISPDAVLDPAVSSSRFRAAGIVDMASGNIIYGSHADLRWPLASITKLMTAEIVIDRMDQNRIITMAPGDFENGGSSLTSSLQPGDQYHVSDLLKILLIPSSNEAAEAFARSYGHVDFINEMNARATTWGLKNTHFEDASGLSAANQSTVGEYLELVRKIYADHPQIFATTVARTANVVELRSGVVKQFATTNNFAGRPGFLGGKTGTTPEAGDNLVSLFEVGGRQVAVLVFGATDRYSATDSLLQLIR